MTYPGRVGIAFALDLEESPSVFEVPFDEQLSHPPLFLQNAAVPAWMFSE